ncbi:Fmu (Sun) domain-containing protein [Flavihumibacter sp. ZG627]|uniref:Fmu (Sun) domain-containing protein n=1 Tax=Flavihumibacter sp. ZG627 TaxID=1463156 RepID=UPI00155AA6E3|nr:Fmu (Sun) domain-containing protein [Flavihumibacter sp. ZG627]
MPFVHFLKNYFSTNKKHGSRDRKQIAQLCYCWFRLGYACREMVAEERLLLALYLCSEEPNPLLAALHEEWNEKASLPLGEKISCLQLTIFPWTDLLSEGIEAEAFSASHLVQPDLFLRIRPGYKKSIIRKLEQLTTPFRIDGENTLRLPNGFKVEDHFEMNKEVVVQDLNSQRIGEMIDLVSKDLVGREDVRIWDCCAASGGKTMLAFDRMPGITFTVTDIRSSILQNLIQRFKQAGIYSYDGFVADLSLTSAKQIGERYNLLPLQDLIIADVPCTGSGTWGRNPEQLYYFNASSINDYSALQKKIISNAIPKLMPGGYFLYITCSVFRSENEENVQFLEENFNLELISSRTLKGYDQKADTMFSALLKSHL